MKCPVTPILLCTLLLLSACASEPEPAAPEVNDHVTNFGLHDQNGDFHELYYYADAEAIVLFVQGSGCPIVRNSIPTLQEVRSEYEPEGVVFLMLNANPQDDRAAVAEEAEAYGMDFPILIDEMQFVARKLNITRTAEAIVIDPRTWRTVFRGPVDDRLDYGSQRPTASEHYLSDALAAHLNGDDVPVRSVATRGCLIDRSPSERTSSADISYAGDIAPILKTRCQTCHQPGGIAPWAMSNYETVRGWAPMMREVVLSGRMPPWHADPHVGTFANDISLTEDELRKLIDWIEDGAPRGSGPDPLESADTEGSGWRLGEPDLTVELDEQALPATGIIDYRYITVDLSLDRDVWVRAVDMRPGNRAVLHHALVSVTYPEGHDAPTTRRSRWLDGLFAAYAPGTEPEVFPEGTGRFLPAGSDLVFQLHYTTTGREESDQSTLGIYFAEEPPAEEYQVVGIFDTEFEIPPYAPAHAVHATHTFEEEVTLFALFPHMHFRGKAMTFEAHYPDGTEELLLSVPNYDFNWQRYYALETPRVLPAGTTMHATSIFDNSPRNRYNPDPATPVHWGEQSFEEMMLGYMAFVAGSHADGAASRDVMTTSADAR